LTKLTNKPPNFYLLITFFKLKYFPAKKTSIEKIIRQSQKFFLVAKIAAIKFSERFNAAQKQILDYAETVPNVLKAVFKACQNFLGKIIRRRAEGGL